MILLKKIKDGEVIIYNEDVDTTIHPFTNKPVKAGDFQYLLVDDNMYRMMKIHMPEEIEFVKNISAEKKKEEEIKVEVVKPKVKEVKKPVVEKEKEIEIKIIKPKVKQKAKAKKKTAKKKATKKK